MGCELEREGYVRVIPKILPAVARKLKYYVYLYVDPRDDKIIYVGKGKGNRALAHLAEPPKGAAERELTKRIKKIRAEGMEPRVEFLVHGLANEETALQIEAAAIDLLGLDGLANAVGGYHATSYGRMALEDVVAHYARKHADIREPVILVRINKLYHHGMSDIELYDATRSAWKVGKRADDIEFALAVFEGVVREVYAIAEWVEGGSTFNGRWRGRRTDRSDRWEFVGTIADDKVRKRYVNRYVGHLYKQGSQNPITYAGPA